MRPVPAESRHEAEAEGVGGDLAARCVRPVRDLVDGGKRGWDLTRQALRMHYPWGKRWGTEYVFARTGMQTSAHATPRIVDFMRLPASLCRFLLGHGQEFKSPLAHANEMASDLGFRYLGWGSFPCRVLSPTERDREAVCCGFLHHRGDMALDVHRGRDGEVSQAILHHLGMLAQLQRECGVRVAQPRDRHAGQRPVLRGDPRHARRVPPASHEVGASTDPIRR